MSKKDLLEQATLALMEVENLQSELDNLYIKSKIELDPDNELTSIISKLEYLKDDIEQLEEIEEIHDSIEDEEEFKIIDTSKKILKDNVINDSYKIIKFSRRYDPEGLNISNPASTVFESDSLDVCKKELKNIYLNFKSDPYYKNPSKSLDFDSEHNQITISSSNYILYYRIVKNDSDRIIKDDTNNSFNQVVYENIKDCLYYGYRKKWILSNCDWAKLVNIETFNKIYDKAFNEMSSDF